MIKTFIIDSFTDVPFKGNPAGVCWLDNSLPDEQMLSIANELGFSETAFIQHVTGKEYSIRFFTPKQETPLCGHATLASFKALNHVDSKNEHVIFKNKNGLILEVKQTVNGLEMQFPVYDTVPAEVPEAMKEALGVTAVIDSRYNADLDILVVEIESDKELEGLAPDIPSLIASHNIYGVIVTAQSRDEVHDFKSRFFWPWSGTDEDPVTGATHTILVKHWGQKLGKNKMKAYQCSERGGGMHLSWQKDKLIITAQATVVFHGEMNSLVG